MSSLTKRPLHEILKKYCRRCLKAGADVSSSHLNKHRLINPLAAYLDETGPYCVDAQAVLPPKISPVLSASLQEQQLAKDMVVAWLSISASSNSVISDTLRNPTTAGELIANVYKTIVQAISETSTVAAGTDATG